MKRLTHEIIKRHSYLSVEDGQVTKFRQAPKDIRGTYYIDINEINGLISIKAGEVQFIIGTGKEIEEIERIENGIIKTT